MKLLKAYIVTLFVSIALLLAILLAVSTPSAGAQDLVVPSYGVVRGDPGSTATVGSATVPAALVGQECDLRLAGENNESIHPDNDLTVTTGSESYTFADIESVAFGAGAVDGTMVLGETVTLTLTFGPDGVTSGGYAIAYTCEPPPSTTVAPPPTTINEPPTTFGPPPTLPPTPPVKNPPIKVPDYTG